MVPEAGSRKGFAPRPARGKNQDRIQRGYGLALWRRKRGVERGSPPARQGGKNQDRIHGGYGLALWCRKRGVERGSPPPPGKGTKIKTASTEEAVLLYGAGSGGRTRTLSPGPDFELFASYGIQTNSNPYGGRQRTPKSPQLLIILKLMC